MVAKLNEILTKKRLYGSDGITVVRVAEKSFHWSLPREEWRFTEIKKWARRNLGYTWGITEPIAKYYNNSKGFTRRGNPKGDWVSYFYIAFFDEQDHLMSRFILDDITPRPMWERNIRFTIYVVE